MPATQAMDEPADAETADPPRRRRLLAISALLGLALVAYMLSPLVSALRFLDAVRRGDEAAVASYVDLPRVRNSVARQIVSDHVRQRDLSGLQAQLARGAGTRVVAAWLEELLTAQSLIDLTQGRIPGALAATGAPIDIRPPVRPSPADALAIWWASGFRGIDEYRLRPRPEAADSGAINLSLTTSGWRVTGLELPADIRADIAKRAEQIDAGAR